MAWWFFWLCWTTAHHPGEAALLLYCSSLGFLWVAGSGQDWFCKLSWGGFGNTSERNIQLPRGTAGLGMWLCQGQRLEQGSGVMLNVSAPSPQCFGRT